MAAIKYWVWLSALRLSPKSKQALMDHFYGDPERMYYSTEEEILSVQGLGKWDASVLKERELDTAMEIMARCEAEGISITTQQDASYPDRLRNIYDAPVVLYSKGRLPNIDEEAAVAVIGTRNASPYGLKMARRFGHDIARQGGVVISGLTRGIDRVAAEGALYADGKVIGVLGTSHDEAVGGIYDEVAARGALISEYAPGQRTAKENFRYRNRITSGLSVGVLVVEAPEGSNCLRFADDALEQGKDVFVLPGNVDAENCAGSNRLLKDGARPVTAAWDILAEYSQMYREKLHCIPNHELKKMGKAVDEEPDKYADFLQVRVPNPKKIIDKPKPVEYIDLEKQLDGLTELQLKIVSAMSKEAIHIDDLIDATGLDPATMLAELTMLQIEGIVSQQAGKRFTLNITRGS